MKKNMIKLIPVLLLVSCTLFSGCKKMKIKEANANFIAYSLDASGSNADTAYPEETLNAQLINGVAIVRVEFKGSGQNLSVWWGTDYTAWDTQQEVAAKAYKTDYEKYLDGDVTQEGALFNKYYVARFRYLVAGDYTVHVIASNWDEGSGSEVKRDIKTFTVHVTAAVL